MWQLCTMQLMLQQQIQHTHTRARAHARAHTRVHAHTHTHAHTNSQFMEISLLFKCWASFRCIGRKNEMLEAMHWRNLDCIFEYQRYLCPQAKGVYSVILMSHVLQRVQNTKMLEDLNQSSEVSSVRRECQSNVEWVSEWVSEWLACLLACLLAWIVS